MQERNTAERRVFVDSSAYLALLDQRDSHHEEVLAIVTRLGQLRFRQFITNIIKIETHAPLLSSLGIAPARAFLREITASNTVIVRARQQDKEQAQQIIFTCTDKDFSLTDAISFTVMERRGITHAFTFDRQYGFVQLTPDLF